MTDLDKAVEHIEQGESWDKTDEVMEVEVKKPLDKIIPVRFSADKWEELRQEARELGIGPTTLARMWILEHLRERVAIFGVKGETRARKDIRSMHQKELVGKK